MAMLFSLSGCSIDLFDSTYWWSSGNYSGTHEVLSSENTDLLDEDLRDLEISFFRSPYDTSDAGPSDLYLHLGTVKQFGLTLPQAFEGEGQSMSLEQVLGPLYEHSGFRVSDRETAQQSAVQRMEGSLTTLGWCAGTSAAVLDQKQDFHHTRRFHLISAAVENPSALELPVEDQVNQGDFLCGSDRIVFLGQMPNVEITHSSLKTVAQLMSLSEPENLFDSKVKTEAKVRAQRLLIQGDFSLLLEREAASGGTASVEINDPETMDLAERVVVIDASEDLQIIHFQLERSTGMRVKDYLIDFRYQSIVTSPSADQVAEAIQRTELQAMQETSEGPLSIEFVEAEDWALRLNLTVTKWEPGEHRSSSKCGEEYEAWTDMSFDYELEIYSESGQSILQSGRVSRSFVKGHCVEDHVIL